MEEARVRKGLSRSLYWYLTFNCNLACRHCALEARPGLDDAALTDGQLRTILDNVASYRPSSVIVSGGEPLIFDRCIDVLEILSRRRIRWCIETNGILVDDEFVRVAADADARDLLTGVYVSLDGASAASHDALRGPGTFDAALAGVERCLSKGIVPKFQFVINAMNVAEIQGYLRLMAELGTDHVKFVFTNPVGRAKRLFDQLRVTRQQREAATREVVDCAAWFEGEIVFKVPPAFVPPSLIRPLRESGVTISTGCPFPMLAILPDAGVSFCSIARDCVCLGNALEVPLSELHHHPRRVEARERYLNGELSGICARCAFRRQCLGDCRVWAYVEGGSFTAPFPLCRELDEGGAFPECYKVPVDTGAVPVR